VDGAHKGDVSLVSVIVPTIGRPSLKLTIESIQAQTHTLVEVVPIIDSKRRGAAWARNYGAKKARGQFLFFCDDDVKLAPRALEVLLQALRSTPAASYAYGWYVMGPHVISRVKFDAARLRKKNYISPMSLVRTSHFIGFDEKLPRWQDWDLWLRMLRHGRVGVFVDEKIFETTFDPKGISGNAKALEVARAVMLKRHGIRR
jgi:glycosyltransferase involved in cell wall biosynthesis